MKKKTRNRWLFFCLFLCSCGNNDRLPNNVNARASFPDSFEFSPAGLKVITSFINRKSGTMSTLYGNPLALRAATGPNTVLRGGEAFTLVTWKQQPDGHWFGASIPGDLQFVEILQTNSKGTEVVINYQRYEGKKLVPNRDTLMKSERIRFILDQRASVMP